MRYALTVNPSGEWDAVDTYIIEDDYMPEEATEKKWLDGGEEMEQLLVKLGYGKDLAKSIVKWHDFFIVNCDDVNAVISEI